MLEIWIKGNIQGQLSINEAMLDLTSPRNRVVEPIANGERQAQPMSAVLSQFNLHMQRSAYTGRSWGNWNRITGER